MLRVRDNNAKILETLEDRVIPGSTYKYLENPLISIDYDKLYVLG